MVLILPGLSSALAENTLTIDFPIKSEVSVPSSRISVPPKQVSTPDGRGYVEFDLQSLPDDEELLVTIVFKENGQEGLSLFWHDHASGRQVIIASDLSDGVTGPNQRTIQIPREVSSTRGKLIIQGNQAQIMRVRLDWVVLRKVYAATDQRPVSFIMSDRFLQSTELTGEKALSPPDMWVGQVFEASLQDGVEPLSENLEFATLIEESVRQALLTLKILGLPLDKAVEVWVNGTKAGQLQPAIPSLADPGYFADASGKAFYAGWRHSALFIPAGLLKAGENSIIIVSPQGDVFVRDASLQLRSAKPAASVSEAEIVQLQ